MFLGRLKQGYDTNVQTMKVGISQMAVYGVRGLFRHFGETFCLHLQCYFTSLGSVLKEEIDLTYCSRGKTKMTSLFF